MPMRSQRREFRSASICHRIARTFTCACQNSGGQPRLALQRLEKLARLADRVPHLRQERRAVAAVFEDHAVDAGPQLREQMRLRRRSAIGSLADSTDTSTDVAVELVVAQAAGSADRGTPQPLRWSRTSARSGRTARERADAAAQFAVLASASRTSRPGARALRGRTAPSPANPSSRANRVARDRATTRARDQHDRAMRPLPCANANDA